MQACVHIECVRIQLVASSPGSRAHCCAKVKRARHVVGRAQDQLKLMSGISISVFMENKTIHNKGPLQSTCSKWLWQLHVYGCRLRTCGAQSQRSGQVYHTVLPSREGLLLGELGICMA